jgi:hypothetical protein
MTCKLFAWTCFFCRSLTPSLFILTQCTKTSSYRLGLGKACGLDDLSLGVFARLSPPRGREGGVLGVLGVVQN